jgi:hypothetical protein
MQMLDKISLNTRVTNRTAIAAEPSADEQQSSLVSPVEIAPLANSFFGSARMHRWIGGGGLAARRTRIARAISGGESTDDSTA